MTENKNLEILSAICERCFKRMFAITIAAVVCAISAIGISAFKK